MYIITYIGNDMCICMYIGALQQSFNDPSQEIQDFSRVKGFVYPKNWQDHIMGEKGLSAIYSMHFHPTIPSLLAAGKGLLSFFLICCGAY